MPKTLIECGDMDVIWDGHTNWPAVLLIRPNPEGYSTVEVTGQLQRDQAVSNLSALISAFEVIIRELKDAEVAERLAQEEYIKNV